MISQVVVLKEGKVLMVRQHVQRGAIVWNFPGGGIEKGETPEEAAVREAREETGYEVNIVRKVYEKDGKFTFLAEITGGEIEVDKDNPDNADIIEADWISLSDRDYWDDYTTPIINLLNF